MTTRASCRPRGTGPSPCSSCETPFLRVSSRTHDLALRPGGSEHALTHEGCPRGTDACVAAAQTAIKERVHVVSRILQNVKSCIICFLLFVFFGAAASPGGDAGSAGGAAGALVANPP